jgi:hypothetical protein
MFRLVSVKEYAPDRVLPPHLSPFDDSKVLEVVEEEAVEDQESADEAGVQVPKANPKSEKKQKALAAEEENRLA